MCFSVQASFAASAILEGGGVLALSKTSQKRDVLIAAVPLIFGMQQFFEGLVWMFPIDSVPRTVTAYIFLFFAFLVWPTYIPIATWSHERDPQRRFLLKSFIFIGVAVTVSLLYFLFTQSLEIQTHAHRLFYQIDIPYEMVVVGLYLVATVGSLILSTDRFVRWFGLLSFTFAGVAWVIYEQAFTSVWCYFAAVLSFIIVIRFLRTPQYAKKRR